MKLLPFVFKESIFWCYISFLCLKVQAINTFLFMVGSPFKKVDGSRGLDILRTCFLVMNYIQMFMFIFRHSGKTQHSNEHYEQSLNYCVMVFWRFLKFMMCPGLTASQHVSIAKVFAIVSEILSYDHCHVQLINLLFNKRKLQALSQLSRDLTTGYDESQYLLYTLSSAAAFMILASGECIAGPVWLFVFLQKIHSLGVTISII